MIASLRVSGAVLGVFIALDVTFVLLTIGAFNYNSSLTHAALCPCWAKRNALAATGKLLCPEVMPVSRWP